MSRYAHQAEHDDFRSTAFRPLVVESRRSFPLPSARRNQDFKLSRGRNGLRPICKSSYSCSYTVPAPLHNWLPVSIRSQSCLVINNGAPFRTQDSRSSQLRLLTMCPQIACCTRCLNSRKHGDDPGHMSPGIFCLRPPRLSRFQLSSELRFRCRRILIDLRTPRGQEVRCAAETGWAWSDSAF